MSSTDAAIYTRISQDTEGLERGVERQEQDCRDLADRLGLTVVDVFSDNDIGASTRSRKKRRPAYERMLEDARAGRFGVILAYSNSRLTRRPLELEDLIALHERHGVELRTVVSGDDNLSTADGRMVARIKASVDAAEVERTAERVARAHLQMAQSGEPVGGTRPFGWDPDKRTLHPVEAGLVRDAAEAILAGVTAVTIAKDWNRIGVPTTRGNAWSGEAVKQVLRSPRVAGWRVHREGIARGCDGEPVRGRYDAILDDSVWRAVVVALRQPEKRSRVPRKGRRTSLLGGVLRCGVCGGPMWSGRVGWQRGGQTYMTHVYRCDAKSRDASADHGNAVSGEPLDELVGQRIVELSELVREIDPAPAGADERLAAIHEEISAINDLIADVMAAFRERRLSGSVVFDNVTTMEARRDELAAERDALEASPARREPVSAQSWAGYDVDRRRALVERLAEAVYVHKPDRRTNRFDPERVEIVWRR